MTCNVISVRTDWTSKELIIELDRKDERRAKVAIARDFKGGGEWGKGLCRYGRGPVNRPAFKAGKRRVRLQVLDGPDAQHAQALANYQPPYTEWVDSEWYPDSYTIPNFCMYAGKGCPLSIWYILRPKLGDQSSLASKAVSSVSERKCAWMVYGNSSPLRGRLGHDGYDILLGVLPHYRDPTPLLVLGKMPRNFKAKREETRSMVGPVDEAIAILLDSTPNGDQRPISPPYAWEVDENPFPIGYPLPSLKIVRGFGFCQCLSISCCSSRSRGSLACWLFRSEHVSFDPPSLYI